ncbi:MAG: signal peptidase II [Pigmentiphaga sp.]|uniref:signal peptidase II n=1 Tax=Pigmentiphaga sp. TaxID=1977564 RepID=UPI0029B3D54B|nr:signal peptidase II [Pigmentiphaga sp.]MDX3904176.1 signal peptidase II [Pigmentiphaga sp.]
MGASAVRPRLAGWLVIAGLIIVADQITKIMVDRLFAYGERLPLLPVLDLTLLYNRGAAFSFLAGAAGWQRWFFTVLALAVSGFIVWMLARHGDRRLFSWSLTLILGGALGNVIDRFLHGHVIDFVLLHYGGWFFPAFNLADSAITIGAVLLILDEIKRKGN